MYAAFYLRRTTITIPKSQQSISLPFGEIFGNNNIPITNSFNRCPIFTTITKSEHNKEISSDSPVNFDGTSYSFSMIGSRLNQSIDYPILSLVIKNWLNERKRSSSEPVSVFVSLQEIFDLLGKTYSESRSQNIEFVIKSLNRLSTSAILLTIKKNRKPYITTERSALLASSKTVYGEQANGYIEVKIGDLLKSLYTPKDGHPFPPYTFMDVESIAAVKSSNAQILLRYLMTQRNDYIEFDISLLLSLIDPTFITNKSKITKREREKILKSLKKLVELGHVTAYKTDKESSWKSVKIITSKVTESKAEAELIISSGKTNRDYYKKSEAIQPAPRPNLSSQ